MPEGPSFSPEEERPKIEIAGGSQPRERLNYEKLRRKQELELRIVDIERQMQQMDEQDKGNLPDGDLRQEAYQKLDDERKDLRKELNALKQQIDDKGWEKIAEETPVQPPVYAPETPSYTSEPPPYTPEPVPYAPYSPEPVVYGPQSPESDFRDRALEAINRLVQRDGERARERYRGLLGRARQWFDREGRRQQAQTLEQAGVWEKNPKWKKWLKIGAKIAGGAGVATAMVMTGGAGAILTPLLWSAGVREAWDGALQTVEELGWGRKRSGAELDMQSEQSQAIETLKERVNSGDINEQEFQQLINEMMDSESRVIQRQETNLKSERKWQLGRSIASTALTIGTGIFAGVPLGTHDYDMGRTRVGNVFLDQSHRVMWNLHGGHFLYNNPEEMSRVAGEVARHGYEWTIHGVGGIDTYGIASHTLGHGLPAMEKIGMGAAVGYLAGRWLEQYWPRKGRKGEYRGGVYEQPIYYPPDYTPTPGVYGAEGRERSVEQSHASIERYMGSFSQGYRQELEGFSKEMPPMNEKCKAVVCIPTAYSEAPVIYHSLEQYIGQKESKNGPDLASETFEINVFVNGPEDKKKEIDRTIGEIKRFQHDHPEINVRVFSKIYPEKTTIGEIRKTVNDLAILRAQSRSRDAQPIALVSNDADMQSLDSDYLAQGLREFQENPGLEMIAGKVDYQESQYRKYPFLLAARRLWQFEDIVMRHRRYADFLPKTLGNNSFIRGDAYARAGGYRRDAWVAEDLRIAGDVARSSGREAIAYKNISVTTDPRRDIAQIEKGQPLVHSYNEFGMRENIREPRSKPIEIGRLNLESRDFKPRLEQEASAIFQDIWQRFFWVDFDRHPDVIARRKEQGREAKVDDLSKQLRKDPAVGGEAYRKAGRVFRRTMGFWGAEYELKQDQNGRIRVNITDWSKLREGLINRP